MSQSIVAKRYARALFEAARDKGQLDLVEKEWEAVAEALRQVPEARAWMAHPSVTPEQKKAFFSKLLENVSELTKNLLLVLIDRRREGAIEGIGEEYKLLANESRGIADAEVVTARPLTDKEEKELIAVFQKRIGKTLVVKNRVDSDLLGGVIVKIGDRLYDGSLAGKLERFQKQLKNSRVG
ncbi:F0F1 ATP synthase subunit delta [Salinithrix halophila]|uniref:ATP synthase subunit delta n=1 Tax=Salinithrix halophila TaxID=1485204 RepID=A0ABV8JK44_9BACL